VLFYSTYFKLLCFIFSGFNKIVLLFKIVTILIQALYYKAINALHSNRSSNIIKFLVLNLIIVAEVTFWAFMIMYVYICVDVGVEMLCFFGIY
jgi:hypothetical protein